MKVFDNVLGLVGNTPLVKLNRLTEGIKAQVYAKMESLNPGYSVKDRIGRAMIDAAERQGKIRPGGTIVEATSGNTGVGLALTAAVRGYRCIFVMTDKCSVEKIRYLKALGADVVVTPATAEPGTPDHYISVARRIAADTPGAFYPDQYSHPANPEAHYRTTGPELWEQTEGRITHFVSGIGTGGTISGTGRFLKEKNPRVRIVGADPYGSIFKTYKDTGHFIKATPWLVEGIGQNVLPENAQLKYVDEVINVTDQESFNVARQLGRQEGIFCGGSTGTNAVAALKAARELDESGLVVFIVCDTGEHYLSKFHSDEWMKEKRLLEPQRITAGLIIETKGAGSPRTLICVGPDTTVADGLAKMKEFDLTQLPVLDEGRSVGAFRESRVLARVLENRELLNGPVRDVMGDSFPVVNEEAPAQDILHALQDSPAALVEDYGRIIGIITRHDMLEATAAQTLG
jgi:cystathionine beta-synthase